MLKILKIIIPIILILIIVIIGFNSYKKASIVTDDPISVIPTNAAIIIQFNKASKLHYILNNTEIWKQLCNISIIDSINDEINNISNFYNQHSTIFHQNSFFISFHKIGINNSGILFSSNFDIETIKEYVKINSLLGEPISKTIYNNQYIFEVSNEKKTLFIAYKNDVIFLSQNKMLVEDAIRTSGINENLNNNTYFSKLYSTLNSSSDIHVLLNFNLLFELTNLFTKDNKRINSFSEWTATDINIKDQLITANGFSTVRNNPNNFTDLFKSQSSKKTKIIDIIPESTSILFSIGFSDANALYTKKNELLVQQNNFWSWDKRRKLIEESYNVNYKEFINELELEAGTFNTSSTINNSQQYVYLRCKNPITGISLIQGLIKDRINYQEYSINTLADPNFSYQLFGDLFNYDTPYFIIINDYLIFSSTQSSLENLIDNYKINKTLSNNQYFKKYKNNFLSKSNLFFYINPGRVAKSIKNSLISNFNDKIIFNNDSILKFTGLSLQMLSKKDLMLNNLSLYYEKSFKLPLKEEWLSHIDTSSSMNPQLVKNHSTNEKTILIQNNNNKLFAINSNGDQMWNLQIETKIIGNISTIDYYNNFKYQYLFNTSNMLYLIDRNGNSVEGYPKELPNKTDLGHALFDYNNTKRYRIIIVGIDQKIYNIDKKGKIVKGWKYINNDINIKQTPRHFVIDSDDYIIAESNNSNTQLLAINGSKRVDYKIGENFNGNKMTIDKSGTIYAITNNGKLWRGDLNGNSNKISLPKLDSSSLFLINEQQLNKKYIFTNREMLFILDENFKEENYFDLKSKITDLSINNYGLMITTESKELYMIKNKKIAEGFPININGYFNISDIDNNGKTNIITSKNGFIFNYELSN